MSNLLKLASLNVRGISNFHKRRTMFTCFRKRKADIIFLQEIPKRKQKNNRRMNGVEKCFSHMVAQIHVGLQY